MQEPLRTHFIGIGGSGMSSIAQILLAAGEAVSGSDAHESAILERLRTLGARVYLGHRAEHVQGAGRVVVSTAVPPDNVELVEARRLRLPVLHRSEVLAQLMHHRRGVAVAGTHGKTTTSAMIGQVFAAAGLAPTVVLGAELPVWGSSARAGVGEWLIAEADESDRSFLHLHPEVAVITNIDDDHLEHYGSLEGLIQGFGRFAGGVRDGGLLVACGDDPGVRRLLAQQPRTATCYGFSPGNDYRAVQVDPDGAGGSRFHVLGPEGDLGEFRLRLPGRHNVWNALATIAVARHAGLQPDEIAPALAEFRGARRRFELLGEAGGIRVMDDYAHHPTEIAATLVASRAAHAGRLVVLFQPHRYSRTRQLYPKFGPAFQAADQVWVSDVYPAGEPPIPGVSGELIAEAVQATGHPDVRYVPDLFRAAEVIEREMAPGDLVMTMGAGNVREAGEWLARRLKARV